MSDVLEILKRGDSGLEALLRAVLLDSENKIPAERLRIVGALADGAIIEQGSNANGEYIRWANGTQICMGSFSVSWTTEQEFVELDLTYPAIFIEQPYACSATYGFCLNGAVSFPFSQFASTLHIVVSPVRGSTFGNDTTSTFRYIAIGRWKA